MHQVLIKCRQVESYYIFSFDFRFWYFFCCCSSCCMNQVHSSNICSFCLECSIFTSNILSRRSLQGHHCQPRPRRLNYHLHCCIETLTKTKSLHQNFAPQYLAIGLMELLYFWFIQKFSSRPFIWFIYFYFTTNCLKVIDCQTILLAGSQSLASIWKQDSKLKPINTLISFCFQLVDISFLADLQRCPTG